MYCSIFVLQKVEKDRETNQWYLDNGCSKHMTGDISQFVALKLKSEGYVTYGDNNCGRIFGKGDIGIKGSTMIGNVLYVDGLKDSLHG